MIDGEELANDRRYFRFLARAVPSGSVIRTDDYDSEPVHTQFSADELGQLDLRGLPLEFDHGGAVTTGKVVDSFMAPDDSLLVLVEIKPVSKIETVEDMLQYLARGATVNLVENGFLRDVSLKHKWVKEHKPEYGATLLTKYPMELSVTPEGGRANSEIVFQEWSDEPYLTNDDERDFQLGDICCKSAVVYESDTETPPQQQQQQHQDLHSHPQEEKEKPTQRFYFAEQQQKMSLPGTTTTDRTSPADMQAVMAKLSKEREERKKEQEELAALRAKMDEIGPIADQALKQKAAEDAAAREEYKKSSASVFDNTQRLIKLHAMLTGKKVEEDEQAAADSAKLEEQKTQIMPMLEKFLSETNPAAQSEVFQDNLQMTAAQSAGIAAFNNYAGKVADALESRIKEMGTVGMATPVNTAAPRTGAAGKPRFSTYSATFGAMAQNKKRRLQEMDDNRVENDDE